MENSAKAEGTAKLLRRSNSHVVFVVVAVVAVNKRINERIAGSDVF